MLGHSGCKDKEKIQREQEVGEKNVSVSKTGLTTLAFIVVIAWLLGLPAKFFTT